MTLKITTKRQARCLNCGAYMFNKRADKKTCGVACKVARYRARTF